MKRTLLLAVLLLPALATAQTVTAVDFNVQSTMNAPAGDVEGCGLRFFASIIADPGARAAELVDGSISAFVEGYAAIKAGHFNAQIPRDLKPEARFNPQPSGARLIWVRIGESPSLKPLNGKVFDSPSKGYQTYPTSFEAGIAALSDLAAGQRLWVAFQPTDSAIYRIFAGPLKVGQEVSAQYRSCFDGFDRALQSRLKDAERREKR
ncbi:MAG: hypothetical protein AB7L76_23455 [Burkholderiaceae bacterium]